MTSTSYLRLLALLFPLLLSGLVQAQARDPAVIEDPDYSELLAMNTNPLLGQGIAPAGSLSLQPANLLRTAADETHLLWVELKKGLLHLLQRDDQGGYTTLETHPISMGKQGYGKEVEGDQRTPVGVYTITSFLPDEELIDRYGSGAFPLDYPNVIDRLASRTGYGIWLHGLPKGVDSRPLFDSDGCVVVDNQTLVALGDYIDIGRTKMILSETLNWVTPGSNRQLKNQLEQRIENWRQSWSAIDNDTYLSFYSDEFTNFDQDFEAWETYKRRIHRAKSWIDVSVSDISLISYPDSPDLVLAEFNQVYESSNFNARGLKQQLWKRENDGVWRIIYEGGGG